VDLGSRASYPAASLGLPPLAAGARLAVRTSRFDASRAGLTATVPPYAAERVRVIVGPHEDRVDAHAFLAGTYMVDERSDRMGVRLRGARVDSSDAELVTTGMVEGAIQIPRGGDPIVLLADHQTTGGYPVVATVIAADLPLIAQRQVGEIVRFVPTTDAEAVDALQRVRREAFALRVSID
jgi:allophanate hydrolase subunit 2